MKVTVFGASGKVGRLVVDELLKQGHEPTVFVHNHDPFKANSAVRTVKGDTHYKADVQKALKDSEAVISALGSWGTESKDILSSAVNNIIPAMEGLGIIRLISLTGAEAQDSTDKAGVLQRLSHFAAGRVAGKILNDGEKHIRLLRDSQLDWTVIRSPVMNRLGKSEYALRLKWSVPVRTINRQAVAKCLVDQLTSRDFSRESPTIFRR